MLISIIIPTHNRYKYAIKTIDTVVSLAKCVEVVVADTSDKNDLADFIENHKCSSQIKHVRPGAGLSVVDNFNAGLAEASGDYLIFLGDDDFISADILNVATWAKDNGVDSVKFTFPALYYWPDFRHARRGDAFSGTLRITEFTGEVKKHDAKAALDECLKSFGDGPINMPRAYLGLMSKGLTERIIKKYGHLFGGVSPDVYSACLISAEAQQCFIIDFPVVIPGASSVSTSGQSAEGKHVGKLRGNAHIAAFKNLKWDERIPEFYSVPTVWSYSLLKATEKLGIKEKKVNFSRLFVKCLFYHFRYRNEIFRTFLHHCKKTERVVLLSLNFPYAVACEFIWLSGKALARLRYKNEGQEANVLNSLGDVSVANVGLSKYLKQKGVRLVLKKTK